MQKKIAKLIQTAHAHQIDCCICGQAPVEHPVILNKKSDRMNVQNAIAFF